MPASTSASASMARCRHALGAVAEQPAQLLERLPALRIGVGIDQVGQRLDLGEVELAVLERAAGELAGLRQPQSFHPPERGQHRGDDGAPAMQLQLGGVLAGFAARPRKPQHQRLVDDFGRRRIAHAREHSLARLRHAADQRLQRVARARARDAHHRNRRRRAAGGEGKDGVGGDDAGPIPAYARSTAHRGAGSAADTTRLTLADGTWLLDARPPSSRRNAADPSGSPWEATR